MTYEHESSDRITRGSVAISQRTWWSAEIAVPMTGDQSALLTIERHGVESPVGGKASFVIPTGEADAVLTLFTGVFAQARQDGVLVEGPSGT